MSTERRLTISLLLPIVAISAAAQAGTTISGNRYWPSEVRPSTYRAGHSQSDLSYALASGRATPRPQAATKVGSHAAAPTPIGGGRCVWRYQGGPKSPMTCARER